MDMAKLLRMESVSHDDKYSVRFAPLGSDAVFKHMDMTGLPYRILDEQQGTRAEGVIPEDGRLPRIEFDTPDEAVLVVGEESWNWSEVPTVRTREDDDSDAPEATDGDGPQDEPADSEDSKYARQGGSAGAGQFLAESAVQAYLNALA
jgi:type VI secretion system secreted protein VgrG